MPDRALRRPAGACGRRAPPCRGPRRPRPVAEPSRLRPRLAGDRPRHGRIALRCCLLDPRPALRPRRPPAHHLPHPFRRLRQHHLLAALGLPRNRWAGAATCCGLRRDSGRRGATADLFCLPRETMRETPRCRQWSRTAAARSPAAPPVGPDRLGLHAHLDDRRRRSRSTSSPCSRPAARPSPRRSRPAP